MKNKIISTCLFPLLVFGLLFWFGCGSASDVNLNGPANPGIGSPNGENPSGDTGENTDPAKDPSPETYLESFSGAEGAPWPSPWQIAENSNVLTAQISGGRAQLQGPTGVVARMVQTDLDFLNCDGSFTVEFENFASQGCGFYCRQNGGYLTLSDPHGQGYAVFLEGNSGSLTLWYERDGDEIQHQSTPVGSILGGSLLNNTPYRVRMQVRQISPTETQQRAKLWPLGEAEPAEWHVVADETPFFGEPPDNPLTIPELQNVTGGLALDIYNYGGTGSIFLSDLEVIDIP